MTRETINNEDRGVSLKSVKHVLYDVCLHEDNRALFNELLERVNKLRDWEEYMAIKKQSSGDLISRQDAIKAIDEKAKRIKNEDTLNGLAGAVGILFDLSPVNPQESKYCDRNICMANEYNGIGCDECEVQKPTDENLHREREQAYMQGYEDASKKCRQEQKTGHWRHYEGMLICSECGAEFYDDIMEYCGDDVPKYCPNCGERKVESQKRSE